MPTVKEAFRINLTIPEHSTLPTISPAIGLNEAVPQKGSENPFDLGQALVRGVSPGSDRWTSDIKEIGNPMEKEKDTTSP